MQQTPWVGNPGCAGKALTTYVSHAIWPRNCRRGAAMFPQSRNTRFNRPPALVPDSVERPPVRTRQRVHAGARRRSEAARHGGQRPRGPTALNGALTQARVNGTWVKRCSHVACHASLPAIRSRRSPGCARIHSACHRIACRLQRRHQPVRSEPQPQRSSPPVDAYARRAHAPRRWRACGDRAGLRSPARAARSAAPRAAGAHVGFARSRAASRSASRAPAARQAACCPGAYRHAASARAAGHSGRRPSGADDRRRTWGNDRGQAGRHPLRHRQAPPRRHLRDHDAQ